MARRKQSLFEDLIDFLSKLPWWACILVAVVGYLAFHQMAVMEIHATGNIKDMGGLMVRQALNTLGVFGQYLLPFAALIALLISVFSRRKRNALHAQVADAGV